MKRINILYLSIPLICWALWSLFHRISRSNAAFYGFAENKENGINLDQDLVVQRIAVKPGQYVQKGALLIEATRPALVFKMSDLAFQIAELQSRDLWRAADVKAQIEQLRAERAEKAGEIRARIAVLESEQELNRLLISGLQSTVVADSSLSRSGPAAVKMNALREELRLAIEPVDREIARLEKALTLAGAPTQTQVNKLKNDVQLYRKEQDRLLIYAPTDGLVGAIHCKEGENMSAFSVLLSFYEKNPNMVVGYIHESMSLKINLGDSLRVSSILHPTEQCMGRISGLGHRIVEIPERLRKIPEILSYGREVMIDIPGDNQFLQKEKVYLQWPEQSVNPITGLLSR